MSAIPKQIITRAEELRDLCSHLTVVRRFGFDTEFVGEDSFLPHLCLVQVATEDCIALIDPFTVGSLEVFWKVVVDPTHQVIAHAAREEIRHCRLSAGRGPGNLFDTQIAAGLIGLNYPISFSSLVHELVGVNLTKTETLTDWRKRPLTDRQIQYAFDDVRFLLPMYRALNDRLEELGRGHWAREEFDRQVQSAIGVELAQEKWRRLRGLGNLSRRQLAVVREIFQWREETAARLNRPPRAVCRDDLMVEIARRAPRHPRDIQSVRGVHRRDIEPILSAVERANALPLPDCPLVEEREFDPPQLSILVNLLSALLGHLSNEMHLAPNLVATSSDLKILARAHIAGVSPDSQSILNEGWRAKHVRPALEKMLTGQSSLRVKNLNHEAPLHIDIDS